MPLRRLKGLSRGKNVKVRRIALWVLVVIAVIAGSGYALLVLTFARASFLPELRNGDIVFQTSGSGQSLAIFLASGSPYTHTGIVKLTDVGPAVIEAVGPVRETPLEDWIGQGDGKRLAVMRVRGLSDDQAKDVFNSARAYYGRPYDPYFTFGMDRVYCSELVWQAFKDAGILLGRVEKIGALNLDNAPVRNLVKRRWQNYPPCGDVDSFETCWDIMLDQPLITPVAIARDERLDLVYSNYGPLD